MRDIIVTLMIFGALPFILVRPYVGILVWSWVGIMNPHRLCWGFASEMPFAQIIAIATIFGFLYYRDKMTPNMSTVLWLWMLFVIWTGVTTYFALYPEAAFFSWNEFMKISFMVFLTIIMTSDKGKLQALVWVVVASLGFYGLKGGIFTIVGGGQYHVWGPPLSFIADNNALALALVMGLPLIRYLQLNTDSILTKKVLTFLMVATVFAILGTQSRGGFLALAAMSTFLVLKSRHKFAFGVVVLISVPLFLTFMPQSWHDRMESIKNYNEDESALMRINAWQYTMNFSEDYPIVGGGFDSFTPDTFNQYAPNPEIFTGAHSIYFETLGEHGYVGLILFVLLGIAAFRQTGYIIKKAKQYDDMLWAKDLAAMIQVSIIGYAVAGTFLELATFDLYYVLISMIIVMNTLLVKRMKSVEAASGDERVIEVEGVQIVGVGRKPA